MSSVQLAWEATYRSPSDLLHWQESLQSAAAKFLSAWWVQLLLVALYISVIGGVSAYDSVLTARYSATLYDLEQNPVGRWIMNLDDWEIKGISPVDPPSVGPFLALKALGTFFALSVIVGLIFRYQRIGHAVGAGVTLFQLCLAGYLILA